MSPTCVWAGTPADLLTRICFSVSLHDPPRSASVRINILVGHWIEGHFHAPQVYWGWKTHWEKRNCEEKKCLKSVQKFKKTREIAKESPCYKKTRKKIGCDKRKEQGHTGHIVSWTGWGGGPASWAEMLLGLCTTQVHWEEAKDQGAKRRVLFMPGQVMWQQ